MAATPTEERLNVRLPADAKELIATAAAYSGLTLSGFVVATLTTHATTVIRERKALELSSRDHERFMAIIDNPDREPNEALKAAFAKRA